VKPIARIILLIVIAAAANEVLVRWHIHAAAPTSWAFSTEAQLQDHEGPIEWLILGDSRAKCGVMPQHIVGSFNLATLGGQYMQTYYRLKRLVKEEGREVHHVILPMDTHSLAWQRDRLEESAYWVRYMNYATLATRSGAPGHFAKRYLTGRLFPYAGRGDDMIARIIASGERTLRHDVTRGYIALEQSWSDRNAEARATDSAGRSAFVHDEYACINPMMTRYFQDTLALCAEEGIPVVLVRYPVAKELHDAISAHVPLEEVDAVYATATADSNVTAIDFMDAFTATPEFFADGEHLNAQGAEAFTHLLNEELMAL
jgi:hypothetical protein